MKVYVDGQLRVKLLPSETLTLLRRKEIQRLIRDGREVRIEENETVTFLAREGKVIWAPYSENLKGRHEGPTNQPSAKRTEQHPNGTDVPNRVEEVRQLEGESREDSER